MRGTGAGGRQLFTLLACAAVAIPLASCGESGGQRTVVKTVTVEAPTPAVAPAPRRPPRPRPAAPAQPTQPAFDSCDANLEVRAETTTCGFAQNVIWHYWTSGEAAVLEVYSPAAKETFTTECTAGEERISCTTRNAGELRFSQAAIDSYSQDQADSYAASHDLGPDPYEGLYGSDPSSDPSTTDPAAPSVPTPTAGDEIPNYPNGNGYRVQCADGMYSQSGGIQGACSGHGGVR